MGGTPAGQLQLGVAGLQLQYQSPACSTIERARKNQLLLPAGPRYLASSFGSDLSKH